MSEVLKQLKGVEEYFQDMVSTVDINDRNLQIAAFLIAFNPIFWNIAARLEYYTKFITKVTGSAKKGCYLLAVVIFGLGIFRDMAFHKALASQAVTPALNQDYFRIIGYLLIGSGQVLVCSAFYQLGITGTYLGDYFGILMDDIVTSFPFSVSNNPMYLGSTLSFLGYSLLEGKFAGVLVSCFVNMMYSFATSFEEPFTAKIYSEKEAKQK
ncbi:hypothetical protein HG535_0G05490 [Zygotorulaspora mrakii]|uniref:Phosphatidyl-N-methylethanolamine N-methyltransferase n=1 Tax=Zygotorulaspora mrakii TaxID=42260 RepID=A0A7H9B8H1_ZYGMR|nr:uncharacterized protein HG535_0G05490 [Zygotorulaspora mrakii]QLG74666.1 hypothetical protein HG535_0G05490 [Zygotorulaspora mrakii]